MCELWTNIYIKRTILPAPPIPWSGDSSLPAWTSRTWTCQLARSRNVWWSGQSTGSWRYGWLLGLWQPHRHLDWNTQFSICVVFQWVPRPLTTPLGAGVACASSASQSSPTTTPSRRPSFTLGKIARRNSSTLSIGGAAQNNMGKDNVPPEGHDVVSNPPLLKEELDFADLYHVSAYLLAWDRQDDDGKKL